MKSESTDKHIVAYKSQLDTRMTVVIIWPRHEKYHEFESVFKTAGHAFVIQEKKIVAIDGVAVDEEWFTSDHLLVIEAHELGHIIAKHGPNAHGRSLKREREADWVGYNILVNADKNSAAILHRQEYHDRYRKFPEEHDDIMEHLNAII